MGDLNDPADPFVDRIIADLLQFSGELVEAGAAPAMQTASRLLRGAGLTSMAVLAAERLAGRVPQLLANVEAEEDWAAMDTVRATRSPRHAMPSRQPADYARVDGHWAPTRWEARVRAERPAQPPLRWLMHLIGQQEEALQRILARLTKQVEEAVAARQGESVWAEADLAALKAVLAPAERALRRLQRARLAVHQASGQRVIAAAALPDPYPRAPVWQLLRAETHGLLRPKAGLKAFLRQMRPGHVLLADVPYLYQRWCGLKLLQALEKGGWRPDNDPAGPLFLGGRIGLTQGGAGLTVWVEPRIGHKEAHPSGFRSRYRGEVTPDYLLVAPGRRGLDAWVVDATKTRDEAILRGKAKYLESIVSNDPVQIAGVPVERAPLRAWAAAPLRDPLCRLFAPSGRSGALPLHPLQFDPAPLDDWVADVTDHALAWAGVAGR